MTKSVMVLFEVLRTVGTVLGPIAIEFFRGIISQGTLIFAGHSSTMHFKCKNHGANSHGAMVHYLLVHPWNQTSFDCKNLPNDIFGFQKHFFLYAFVQ